MVGLNTHTYTQHQISRLLNWEDMRRVSYNYTDECFHTAPYSTTSTQARVSPCQHSSIQSYELEQDGLIISSMLLDGPKSNPTRLALVFPCSVLLSFYCSITSPAGVLTEEALAWATRATEVKLAGSSYSGPLPSDSPRNACPRQEPSARATGTATALPTWMYLLPSDKHSVQN